MLICCLKKIAYDVIKQNLNSKKYEKLILRSTKFCMNAFTFIFAQKT